jgi:chromate transporter
VVERRRWLSAEEMLDGVSLATILPGPVAVNVVAYAGYRVRGVPGALVSAAGVILPAFLLILALSAAYFAWGSVPSVTRVFQGFIPAVAAIVLVAAWNMGRKAVKGVRETLLLILSATALLVIGGFWVTLGIIVAAGIAGVLLFRQPETLRATPPAGSSLGGAGRSGRLLGLNPLPLVAVAPFLSTDWVMAGKLLVTFAGMSVFLFGGGYVFIPFIQEIVVDSRQWLTSQEFVDAIALGQVTPGPILISATFIGYKLAGLLGACVATVGIFLPPAVLMIAGAHALDRIRKSGWINAALAGIRPAVVGMIAAAAYTVAQTAAFHWVSVAIFAAALAAMLRFRVDVVWVIPSAGFAGLLFL